MSTPINLAEPLNVGGVELRNRVFLAPLSGITDVCFRQRAYAHGAGLVVSEMIASGELVKGSSESIRRTMGFGQGVRMVQLAGRESGAMAEGARIAEGEGADIIDINMGCPAKKVTGGYSGSALMRDLDHAVSLIDAVVGAVSVPVTVKMRLGWDDGLINAPSLAERAEQSGVSMITVHGRTRCQFYNGDADWNAVRSVRQAIKIPLVVNGDISSRKDAEEALTRSGADAVMIGRAHYGVPWMAGEIAGSALAVPEAAAEISDYIVSHYEDMLGLYGVESGLRQARKHLGWYMDKHAPLAPADLRRSIMTETDTNKVMNMLRKLFNYDDIQKEAA